MEKIFTIDNGIHRKENALIKMNRPLTKNDFILEHSEKVELRFDKYEKVYKTFFRVSIKIKPSVQKEIEEVNKVVFQYKLKTYNEDITKDFTKVIILSGCKTDESKEAKKEKVLQEEQKRMDARIHKWIESMLSNINGRFETLIKQNNDALIQDAVTYFTQTIEVKKYSPKVDILINEVDELELKLKKKREELLREQNNEAIRIFEEHDWSISHGSEVVRLNDEIINKIKETLENKKGFISSLGLIL